MPDLKTYQFDKMQNYPETDARIYYRLGGNKDYILSDRPIDERLGVITSGLMMTVAPGDVMIQGRLVSLQTAFSLTVEPNSSGFLVFEINTFLENTATGTPGQADYTPVNNQVSIKTVSTLQNDNINNPTEGGVYDFNLGSFSSDSSTVTFSVNTNIMLPNQDVIFDGALRQGTFKISEEYNIYEYKFLNIYINSATDGTPFGNGLLVILADQPSDQTVVFADTTAENSHSTYMGKFHLEPKKNSYGNIYGQLSVSQTITNVTHITGKNHGGSSSYYVRKIIGIR